MRAWRSWVVVSYDNNERILPLILNVPDINKCEENDKLL